jgi:hypothetical protein
MAIDEINLEILREANRLHTSYAEVRLKYFAYFTTFNGALFYFYLQTERAVTSIVVALAGIVVSATLEVLDFRASQVVAIAVESARHAESQLGTPQGVNTRLHERTKQSKKFRFLILVLLAAPLVAWLVALGLAIGGISGASVAKP